MSFADVCAHLDGLGMFHMDLGLERMDAALAALGIAEPPYVVAHVVGTNGKGSTSLMLAEIMRAHGLRTGLYGSPHFVTPRERALVDGSMLSEAAWTKFGNEVLDASREHGLTYFEFITVLAALGFARAGCDAVVMEAGLGGRYDAVGSLRTDLTLFTAIGMDHADVLGPTIAHIARDKAGAMRPGTPAVTSPQEGEAMAELQAGAGEVGTELRMAADMADLGAIGAVPAMAGPHQAENATLALAAWTLLAERNGWEHDPAACARAIGSARLPGRFQRLPGSPEIILDGAHNAPALKRLVETIDAENVIPAAIVFACMKDKDLAEIAPLVTGLADCPIHLPGLPGVSRAMPPAEAAAALGPRSVIHDDLAAALDAVEDAPGHVLVCGSLYMLGEFFSLRPDALRGGSEDLDI